MNDNVVKFPERLAPNAPGVPEFITRQDIEAMDDTQLDACVGAIRSRRMNAYHVYKKTKEDKEHVTEAKVKAKIEKKCEQMLKKINTVDKQLDDLERMVAELRGLRLQGQLEYM